MAKYNSFIYLLIIGEYTPGEKLIRKLGYHHTFLLKINETRNVAARHAVQLLIKNPKVVAGLEPA